MILNINEVSTIKKEIDYQGGCCGFDSYVFKFYNQNHEELGTAIIPIEVIATEKERGTLPFDIRKINKSHKENFINWVNDYEWCLNKEELEELE